MDTWDIVTIVGLIAVVLLVVWVLSMFAEDLLLMLLWIPPVVVVGGAYLYLSGQREWFTPVGIAIFGLSVLLMAPILFWLYHEIFDD